jgi:putative ABC transport system permease protein
MILTAFKFMMFDRPKSIGILVGIVISIFLIGQQLATLRFLTGLMTALIENSNSGPDDIWIIDNITENVNVLSRIDSRVQQEIKSIEGVLSSHSILVANASITLPNGKTGAVNLVGSDGPTFVAGPHPSKVIEGSLSDLAQISAVSLEYFNAKAFGIPASTGQTFELNKKQAVSRVLTRNAQGFGGDNMYTSIDNVRYFSDLLPDKVNAVIVKVKPGTDPRLVIDRINKTFYGVRAWEAENLKKSTYSEILISSNMGVSFGSLIVFATISGFFIIGLTLYSSALDRLVDYGTLKAIGATNGYVTRLILTQAFLFAVIGFSIAFALLLVFKAAVSNSSLTLEFDWPLSLLLFVFTLFMSVGGSLFAVIKISRLEPASIF